MTFNRFEAAAINAEASEYPNHEAVILAQFASARIVGRRNTGGGFFVDLITDSGLPPIERRSPIGNVHFNIEGFKAPMGFLIFGSVICSGVGSPA